MRTASQLLCGTGSAVIANATQPQTALRMRRSPPRVQLPSQRNQSITFDH
jgi:hypothetical protein